MTDATGAKAAKDAAGTATDRAFVKMFEIVDASSWTYSKDGTIDDLRPLLLMMDIGSCASAEKHTSVNCVTASMGDVVIEHYPTIGELLELHAAPVDTGRTSLNIAVTVFAHGCVGGGGDDDESDDEDNEDDSSESYQSPKLAQTKRVCEAFFTYVTTRGPNGEKRYVPPLFHDSATATAANAVDQEYSSEIAWERTMARFRKQLIRSEQQSSTQQTSRGGYTISRDNAMFESSEVVLPSHQNHMEHLFGGVVMGWMCKSVQAACVQATHLPLKTFTIRSIQRVDFPTGAEVSDHVFLRPRITAIFDGGRSAEVEVMVGKRNITKNASGNSMTDIEREEVTMNFGYFYVSGRINSSSSSKRLSTSVAPFQGLLQSRSSRALQSRAAGLSLSQEQQERVANESDITVMAHQRRTAMLARRHLLAGIGEPIEWDPLLEVQAPILTILSVLRLCDEYQKSVKSDDSQGPSSWKPIQDGNQDPVWWTYGNSWGNHNTVLLCNKMTISRNKQGGTTTFLQDYYTTLCDNRSKWDPFTLGVRVLEQKSNTTKSKQESRDEDSLYWDVAEYEMKASETAHTTFCLLRAGSYIGADGSLLQGQGNDQNCKDATIPTCGVVASRSVRHEGSSSMNRVLPSGFILKATNGGDCGDEDEKEFLEITYVAEHDFDTLRHSGALGTDKVSDDYIVCFLASCSRVLLSSLASMDHRPAQ